MPSAMTRSQSGVRADHRWYTHLHVGAGVDAREVGEQDELELRVVVQLAHDLGQVGRADPDLRLVVALPDGARQAIGEVRLEAAPQLAVHGQTSVGTLGPTRRSGNLPRRSLTSCWSFIIP